MPAKVRPTGKGTYRVTTPGGVKSKGTTLRKAKAQQRLLNAIEHNPDFTPRGKRKRRRM